MDLREKLAVFALLIAGIAVSVTLGNFFGWVWSFPLFLLIAFTVAATLAIHDDTYRPKLQRLFEPHRVGRLYQRVVIRVARWPRDWRMFDWAMRLAVFYPIGIPLLLWIWPGWAAELGGRDILPKPDHWWQQALLALFVLAIGFSMVQLASARAKGSVRKFLLWLVFPFAFAVAFPFPVAFPFVGAFPFAVEQSVERGYRKLAYPVFSAALLTSLYVTAAFTPWADTDPDVVITFLFLGLLPILNACFDYLSYVLTWTLLRQGVLRPRLALWLGLLDLLAACSVFLLSGAAMVLAIAGLNAVAGQTLYSLVDLFHGIRSAPMDYLWVYLMLFSTILPTALHAFVATFSFGAWLWPALRRKIHRNIDDDGSVRATFTPIVIGLYWTACVVVPSAIVWGLLWGVAQVYEHPLGWYLVWLEHVGCWIGPAICPA
ncbi:hypothetical protein ACN2XU_04370 [Primorskyibacter sp. 2E107]|uniref:hypothetical protein n=1 Tax=Primorskyibacter sp. 2E107 TaxID=3403458 RepID=UPI003AF7A68F